MPAPALAALVPMLAKAPAALKALYASKHFWPLLIGGGFLGQTALGEVGKAGERGLSREQIRMQRLMAESQAIATRRATEESRERAKEYTKTLLKAKKEERKESREARLMESFMTSQDRQVALLMQAIQGIAQQRPQYQPASAEGGGGMLGLMRS